MHSDNIDQMILEGRVVVKRLAQDLNIAESSWAHFEAIIGKTEDSRRDLREAASWLGANFAGLRAALLRDTLLALSRPLDKRPESSLLCQVAKLLSQKELVKHLIEEVANEKWRQSDIALIKASVPLQWNNTKPKHPALYEWRESLEQLRNKMLAHSDPAATINVQGMNFVRDGLMMVGGLVRAAERTFIGGADSSSLHKLTRRANLFWDYAQTGFIEAHLQDVRRRKQHPGLRDDRSA